jgi:mRNA interferase MazF
MGMVDVRRFDVFLISLDPAQGSEINKTRPCIIISPDELNTHVRTVIIAPMTTKGKAYSTRIPLTFLNKDGYIVLDQIRTVDKSRLIKKLGKIGKGEAEHMLTVLQDMFA